MNMHAPLPLHPAWSDLPNSCPSVIRHAQYYNSYNQLEWSEVSCRKGWPDVIPKVKIVHYDDMINISAVSFLWMFHQILQQFHNQYSSS